MCVCERERAYVCQRVLTTLTAKQHAPSNLSVSIVTLTNNEINSKIIVPYNF